MRMLSWNIELSARTARARADLLATIGADLVALQEVHAGALQHVPSDRYTYARCSLELRPAQPGENRRHLGCAILATDAFQPVGDPYLLDAAPAPERSLVQRFMTAQGALTVASIHLVNGSNWGPSGKRDNFRAISTWARAQTDPVLVGVDANSPKIDHPDLHRNGYWPGRDEHLLHDGARAGHALRDTYRTLLDSDPERAAAVRRAFTGHAMVVSHRNTKPGTPGRRYDAVFASTPDFHVHDVVYLDQWAGSSHAPVISTLTRHPPHNRPSAPIPTLEAPRSDR